MTDAYDELARTGNKVASKKYTYKYQIAFPREVYKVMWQNAKQPDSMFFIKGRYLYYTSIYGDRIFVKALHR